MLKKIYEALVTIKAFGPADISTGICNNVKIIIRPHIEDDEYSFITDILKRYYTLWPLLDNTDDPRNKYPVEGSLSGYMVSMNNGDAWDKTKEAGKRRYELLDFLIEKIGEDLKNDS